MMQGVNNVELSLRHILAPSLRYSSKSWLKMVSYISRFKLWYLCCQLMIVN